MSTRFIKFGGTIIPVIRTTTNVPYFIIFQDLFHLFQPTGWPEPLIDEIVNEN